MNSYRVKLIYQDRDKGTAGKTVKVDATTIARGIAKATREFIKGLNRKQRHDANKGLQIEAAAEGELQLLKLKHRKARRARPLRPQQRNKIALSPRVANCEGPEGKIACGRQD